MGQTASTTVTSSRDSGRIGVSVFSPSCQELRSIFTIVPIDCTALSVGAIQVSHVDGGTPPYLHYFDNSGFSALPSLTSPTVGWITTTDDNYRAVTHYMGVGKSITWQHTGTVLDENILSSTSVGFSLPSNTLVSLEEGWIGFRKESEVGWSVGFVDASTSTSICEFRARDELSSDIYVGTTFIATVQALLTDYLRISKEGNILKFYVNEVEVHSHSISIMADLKAKFSFDQVGSSISYPTLSFCTPLPVHDPASITLASTNLSACQGENVPLITPTTQNVSELRWYDSNPDGVSLSPIYVGASFDPDATAAGSLAVGTYTYYVTGIDLNGQETASQAVTLQVHALPTVSISSNSTFCPGSTLHLQVSLQPSTSTYRWFRNGVLLAAETSRDLYITEGGLYEVEVRNAEGCRVSMQKTITQQSLPTVSLSATPASGCSQVTLVATGGGTTLQYAYQRKLSPTSWSNTSYSYSSSYVTTISGTYRISYRNPDTGCSAYSNEVDIVVHPLPETTIYSTPACQGSDVTLSVQNYTPSYTYQWQQQVGGGSWVNVGTTQMISIPYVTGTTASTFKVITTDVSSGCSSSTTRTVYYTPSPVVTYTSFLEADIGESVTFNVTGNASSYYWTGPNGFSSSSVNPSIVVTATSYGEYVLIANKAGCQTTYRAIIAEKGVFATLKENLDASYYHTNREGKLYFKFDEKYGVGATATASVSTFNYDFQEVDQTTLSKEYGYNWYGLDLSSFATEGDHYVLHIKDELDRRYVLRLKYATGNTSLLISEDSEICISNNSDLRSVSLEARSYVNSSPYTIEWYTSTVSTQINQLENLTAADQENLLFAEETGLDNQVSITSFETNQNYTNQNLIYAPGTGMYYVRARITDLCGNVSYSNVITVNVYIGTGCRIADNEITPEKKHRFEVFFSIRRLLSPKPAPTNPTTR